MAESESGGYLRCCCLIRTAPDYRRDAFVSGLTKAGYVVSERIPRDITPQGLLVIWNRYGSTHEDARRYEAAGARVVVAENGYLGREWEGIWYALSLGWHNGAGRWPQIPSRLDRHPVLCRDWRQDGRHIVVLAQRGIGAPPVKQPTGWAEQAVESLRRRTKRPIVLRKHPGEQGRGHPLDDVLRNAWACVTWASGAGVKSIVHGVPVFHAMPHWIGKQAAADWTSDIEQPFLGDRTPMLRSLMSAMWRLDEIESGEAFRALLHEN